MSDINKAPSDHHYLTIGMCFGISIGTAIGVALDNIPFWMSIGLMAGICIGSTIDYEKQKKSEKENNEKVE